MADEDQKQTVEETEANETNQQTEESANNQSDDKADTKADNKPEKKEVKASAKLEKIIDQIKELSVLELSELVHALEDTFGVTAQAPVAMGAVGVAPAGDGAEAPGEEQTSFNVIIASSGANKIAVIKALREVNNTLGLKEAKDLVDAAPKEILSGVNKATATEAKEKLTAAGATVEVK